ncbi:uncharacterized protein ACIGJ3_002577 [Trichechus inunguis]
MIAQAGSNGKTREAIVKFVGETSRLRRRRSCGRAGTERAGRVCGGTMRPDRDAVLEEPVIWISDDETDTETTFENSVMVIEPSGCRAAGARVRGAWAGGEAPCGGAPPPVAELHLEERASEEAVGEDSDLVVTFCRRGSVMPHARYDCPTRPFERTENESSLPVGLNSETCVQCYCYVCDKLASECPSWTSAPSCHCNAHNKSKYWKDERSRTLAGILVTFNLELVEIDADLRRGGEHLLLFTQELAAAYTRYLKGETPPSSQACCACWLRPNVGRCYICRRRRRNKEPVYRYSEIFNLVSSFISQAEKETPKTSAIMLLGAVREIALHKDPALRWENMGTTESLKLAVPLLMARMTQLLQRTLVLGDLPQPLCQKFTRFFQAVPLPPYCFGFTNCLNVAPWDHRLLTTVLRGQNITGPRRRSGKKEFLWEVFAVVRARVERLEGLGQYRELVRYLKAVKCEDSVGLRDLRDKVPFYLCKCGDFTGAAYALLSPVNTLACCTACRLTPAHFESYLKMLWTGGVPAGNDIQDTGHWTVSVGEEPGALVSPRRCGGEALDPHEAGPAHAVWEPGLVPERPLLERPPRPVGQQPRPRAERPADHADAAGTILLIPEEGAACLRCHPPGAEAARECHPACGPLLRPAGPRGLPPALHPGCTRDAGHRVPLADLTAGHHSRLWEKSLGAESVSGRRVEDPRHLRGHRHDLAGLELPEIHAATPVADPGP